MVRITALRRTYVWVAHELSDVRYIVRFIDDPGPVQLTFRPMLYTTSPPAPRGSWCHQRLKSFFPFGHGACSVSTSRLCCSINHRSVIVPLWFAVRRYYCYQRSRPSIVLSICSSVHPTLCFVYHICAVKNSTYSSLVFHRTFVSLPTLSPSHLDHERLGF